MHDDNLKALAGKRVPSERHSSESNACELKVITILFTNEFIALNKHMLKAALDLVVYQRSVNLGVPFAGAAHYDSSHLADYPDYHLDYSHCVGHHRVVAP